MDIAAVSARRTARSLAAITPILYVRAESPGDSVK